MKATAASLVTPHVLRIVIEQPWHNWTFMVGAPRVEIVYHSIHYIDAIRWLVGEPRGVYCRTLGHPATPQLSDTRSSIASWRAAPPPPPATPPATPLERARAISASTAPGGALLGVAVAAVAIASDTDDSTTTS